MVLLEEVDLEKNDKTLQTVNVKSSFLQGCLDEVCVSVFVWSEGEFVNTIVLHHQMHFPGDCIVGKISHLPF